MSTLAVNTITNAAGGNTAQINGMTPTADSLQGFRNRIINGDMRIDQRNAGAAVTQIAGNLFPVDRFAIYGDVASKFTAQRSTTAAAGFTNSLLITSSSSYSVGSGEVFTLSQFVEGFNVADLGFGTANAQSITLSFWVRSSLTGTFGGTVQNGTNARSYPFSYTINAANTFEYKTITIAGDTSGTWATDNSTGLRLRFGLGVGATMSGAAGSWASADYRSATGAVSVVGTSGATFYITGVQLEAGSVATPFERVPYGTQLVLCQRYYEEVPDGRITGYHSTTVRAPFQWKVNKRAAPTVTFSESNLSTGAAVTLSASNLTEYGMSINATASVASSGIASQVSISAEL
jgi:hypothetical protein